MRIKTKLTLGVGLLFMLIILLAGLSVRQINSLGSDATNILKNNYNTLVYVQKMLTVLNEMRVDKRAVPVFEDFLAKQKQNITEVGEKELTDDLSLNFARLKLNINDTIAFKQIDRDLFEIMNLNLRAIHHKSTVASKTSEKSVLWISLLGIFCFLIAFILLIKLPGNISSPIEELASSIKEIAANNYAQRVSFTGSSEFGELAKAFNAMAEKLEEYDKSNLAKILTEKKIIETLINNVHDPIIGLDKNRHVIFANDETQKISGLSKDDLIGKSALELSEINDLIRSIMIMDPLKDKGLSTVSIKTTHESKEIYFEKEIQKISYRPQDEQNEHILGYVIILRNITLYKELDLAKTNFIATVSHELKTPISTIKLVLQLLNNEKIGSINDEQKKLVESAEEETTHLLRIVAELLNLAQVETGNIQLSIAPTDAKEMLTYAVAATQIQADQKNITFSIDCPGEISRVYADGEKTAWVLINLISNAIHYSTNNATIYLRIQEEAEKINFKVQDTGRGIDPQYAKKIFDKFFRVPGTKKEGTGLGLAISKEFIEAQGGQISLISNVGQGSTFTVSLSKVK